MRPEGYSREMWHDYVEAFAEETAKSFYPNFTSNWMSMYFYPKGYDGIYLNSLPIEVQLALFAEMRARLRSAPVQDILNRLEVLEDRMPRQQRERKFSPEINDTDEQYEVDVNMGDSPPAEEKGEKSVWDI